MEIKPEQSDVERAEAVAERIYNLRDHNFTLNADKGGDCYRETCDCIARDFAALLAEVRAEERERCAEICQELGENHMIHKHVRTGFLDAAAAIRGSK